MLASQDSLVQFVVGFLVLVVMQTILAKTATRWPAWHDLLTPKPRPLYHDGRYDRKQMQRCGVGEPEIAAAIRQSGWRNPL